MNPKSPWNRGGLLRPGWIRDTNRTAKPERVLTREQTRQPPTNDEVD